MSSVGLVLDQVLWKQGEEFSTDEAFSSFVEPIALSFAPRIDFVSRVSPESGSGPYILDPSIFDVVPLPWYSDVAELCSRWPRLGSSITRAIDIAMNRWSLVIVGAIHPLAPLVLRRARRRGIPHVLWVRGDYYQTVRHRLGESPLRLIAGMGVATAILRLIPSGIPVISSGNASYRFLRRMGPVKLVYSSKFELGDFARLPRWKSAQTDKILYVGRIAPEKGLEVLLEAVSLLRQASDGGRLSLTMVGADSHGSPYAERFEQHLAASGLQPIVRRVGYVPYGPDLFAYYDEHDVFVLSSHTEGFPQTIFEAMIRGIPVVSTAVGGIPSVIEDGVNGLLVRPRDPKGLALAVKRILDDPRLAARLSKEGQRTARAFTRNTQTREVVAFLESCFPLHLQRRYDAGS